MSLLILDRDGVINEESDDFIKSPAEWLPIKGSLEAIARLSQAGYDVIIITNQSGVGRKLLSADALADIHVRMLENVRRHGGKVQSILFCPHLPEDDCDCRKPATGLYDEVAHRLNTSFTGVFSVGDSLRDLEAAKAAGAIPVLVKTGNGRSTLKQVTNEPDLGFADVAVYDSLSKFADALLTQEH